MRQEEAAKKNGIALASVKEIWNRPASVPLLPGEIKGAEVFFHFMRKGERFCAPVEENKLRTYLLIDGSMEFSVNGVLHKKEGRGSFVAGVGNVTSLKAAEDSHLLEILWELQDSGLKFIREKKVEFPIWQDYEECSQYREDFKTKKSISRSLIDHHILPDFCMGSNESYGPDRVEKHAHPLLDQFFFSFDENDIQLMIDDYIQPYEGCTLLHIPLGSDHGVIIPEGKKMHYVWIDFMVDPGAVAYLDEVHKKTGVQEKFGEDHQITI